MGLRIENYKTETCSCKTDTLDEALESFTESVSKIQEKGILIGVDLSLGRGANKKYLSMYTIDYREYDNK